MGMIKFKSPSLPIPHRMYDEGQQHQLNRSLRIYFEQLDSRTPIEHELFQGGLFNGQGTGLVMPYGSFYSTQTQTAANTTTAYAVTLNNTDLSNWVTLSNGSRLNVAYDGIYNFQFSAQLSNDSNASIDINMWLRKNGVNLANTNSLFGLSARKSPGDPYHVLAALNIFVSLAAGDYIELYWSTTSTSGTIIYVAPLVSPDRPATPSVISTLSFVSALST